MKYMLMIFGGADWADAMNGEQVAAGLAEHGAFAAFLQGRGLPFSGEGLMPPHSARTVHRTGDEVTVTDGPFIDLKEGLGGFDVIEAADLDEAIEVAQLCPSPVAVEVRPVYATE